MVRTYFVSDVEGFDHRADSFHWGSRRLSGDLSGEAWMS
jgi:hypothetical protein